MPAGLPWPSRGPSSAQQMDSAAASSAMATAERPASQAATFQPLVADEPATVRHPALGMLIGQELAVAVIVVFETDFSVCVLAA